MQRFYSLFVLLLCGIQAKRHVLRWMVGEKMMAPDNHAIAGMTINGQFPGPTVTLDMGDSVKISVINRIRHPLTIHWHGILQKDTPEADGVPFVTQDPIAVNGSFTYRFTVNGQSGTFWYHAHTMLHSETVFGALIIKDPPSLISKAVRLDRRFKYDDERTLLLSNIFHTPMDEIYKGLVTSPFTQSPEPRSILTNGGTYDEWDTPADAAIPFNNGYSVITVRPNTRYRFRFIASQGHTYYAVHIPGHNFTVIEADGTLVKPFVSSYIYINSGMRYSAIITTRHKPENFYIHTSIVGAGNQLNNGVAILHYQGAKDPKSLRRKRHVPAKKNLQMTSWFEDQLSTLLTHEYEVPLNYSQSIVAKLQFKQYGGLLRFELNDVPRIERNTTILPSVMNRTSQPEPGVYQIQSNNQGVQFVVQSYALEDRNCTIHPWHVHGHSFYVVGRGDGIYDPQIHDPLIRSRLSTKPIIRDTFTVFSNETPANQDNTDTPPLFPNPNPKNLRSCGWTAIRFLANNPGAWLMHCHYAAHMIMGMQLVVNELPQH